jgi:hypothetical protein
MDTNSSWLKDGVSEIERVVKTGMIVSPSLLKLPDEPPGHYAIVVPTPSGRDASINFKLAKPAWHREKLETPAQLIRFIESMKSDRKVSPQAGAVYISDSQIIYVYDFEDRRNVAICPLQKSEPWEWLEADQPPMNQRDMIRALRITFDGALDGGSSLISVMRNVRWTNDGNVEANLQRGKEALGRQISNAVAGVENFPDEFTVSVPVFSNFAFDVRVRVALEIMPLEQRFEVIPFPNQLEKALGKTFDLLVSQIAGTDVPTFIGSP